MSGKIAIVTGGGSGIGLAISSRLAEDGHAVAVFDVNADSAVEAADRIAAAGAPAIGLAVDVTDRSRIDACVSEVRDRLGPATVLVNCAGLQGFTPFLVDNRREVGTGPGRESHGHVPLLPGGGARDD